MDDSRIKLMASAPIHQAVNKISLPAISGLIIMALYNIVDTMFVAWIGTEATGATQIVMPIIMLSSAIGLALGMGAAAVVSRLLGRKEREAASRICSTTFFLGIILGILFIIVNLIFMDQILHFFGATEAVIELAESYAFYIILGSIFMISNMVMNNLLRSEGSAMISMMGMGLGAILNIILDPLFIFTFGWGISGAAIATTISQGVTFVILLSAFLRKRTVCSLKIKFISFDRAYFKSIMTVGIPTFFKQLLFSLSMAVMNQSSVRYGGADLLAAIGVLTRITLLPTYIIFGLGQGVQPVIGFNQGSGDIGRVRSAFFYAMKVSGAAMGANALLFLAVPAYIMHIFRASTEVTAFGITGLYAYSAALFLYGFSNTITVFFQALGKGVESMILSTARQGFILIPLLIVMGRNYGAQGVLLAQTFSDILTFILSVIFLFPLLKSRELNIELQKGEFLHA